MWGAVCLTVGCTEDATIHNRVLDIAAQQNVNYDSITHIDSIEAAVEFFDHHGTDNERMRAHYLLGCAYRDAGEAPKALECYQQAADCANPDDADCDHNQMIRVYGQMASILYDNFLPNEMLEALKLQYQHALMAKDTMLAINAIEKTSSAYGMLNQIDSLISIRMRVHQLYLKHGYRKEAALALGGVIRRFVEKGNLVKAKQCIDFYEKESGVVTNGEISSSKAIYYFIKGRYYLAAGNPDSAQILFRRLITPDRTLEQKEAGYRGLYLYYKQTNLKDSLAKYADLAYQMNDESFLQAATERMRVMQSLFNYKRHQQLAEKNQRENEAFRFWLVLSVSIVLLLVIVILIIFYLDEQKKKKQRKLVEDFAQLQQKKIELEELIAKNKNEYTLQIEEQQATILAMEEEIERQESSKLYKSLTAIDQSLKTAEIVNTFRDKSNGKGGNPTIGDWKELTELVNQVIPDFIPSLKQDYPQINEGELEVCILTRMHLGTSQIAVLKNLDKSTISKMKARLLPKLFKDSTGGAKEFERRILEMH